MPLDLRDCVCLGPALPQPYVEWELENFLRKHKLLMKTTGQEGKQLERAWQVYRQRLKKLSGQGGSIKVKNHVVEPLLAWLGYESIEKQHDVETREGTEDAGFLMLSPHGGQLRVWTWEMGTDLDAPNRRGRAYRFSPKNVALRVLWEKQERIGLLTNGEELRILIADPARSDSEINIRIASGGWRGSTSIPDSLLLLLALCCPVGVALIPELTEDARLNQTKVTDSLRLQARQAIEDFIQELLDHPENKDILRSFVDAETMARQLWSEGLLLIYRLLFILKMESSSDPARCFSFSSSSLWRNTYSLHTALAPYVRKCLDTGLVTGELLSGGLRALFRLFTNGLQSSELTISPLGGMLFDPAKMIWIDRLHWSERAVATLIDRLLWTPVGKNNERQRVHYGPLSVEDLGRVYEALLELEPGIATEPVCRLRRDKLEVVVPAQQGDEYKKTDSKKHSKVEWVEDIGQGKFYLRVGLGRKASGSYYTPPEFVRFLVQETLGPQVAECSPHNNPQPNAILAIKVLDPAMGSGHFLVEACRYLGAALYEACRLCDELALEAEEQAESATSDQEREQYLLRSQQWHERIQTLPDLRDELLHYLPSRSDGSYQWKAESICQRLVAVHCIYGVDKNPLAVELAKLVLWLESYAEGWPLTFLEHRLVQGDSITGPMFSNLLTFPGTGASIDTADPDGKQLGLALATALKQRLQQVLHESLALVRTLNASIARTAEEIEIKRKAKIQLDSTLASFKLLAAAWSGGVLLDPTRCSDGAYMELLEAVASQHDPSAALSTSPALQEMITTGQQGIPYDLLFPEIFYPNGSFDSKAGFHAVLGNPPWDTIQPLAKEFFAAYDLDVLDAPTRRERAEVEERLNQQQDISDAYNAYVRSFEETKNLISRIYRHVNKQAEGRPSGAVTDLWQAFAERGTTLTRPLGNIGFVLPSAFHANQSATGIRELYLQHNALKHCYSFENRNKIFEIDSRFKFATIVAQRTETGTTSFPCAFYLHDPKWLFGSRDAMTFSLDFIKKTGGNYYSFLELRTPQDAELANVCYANSQQFGEFCENKGIRLGRELHMTDDAMRFTPVEKVLPEGIDPRDPDVTADLLAKRYLVLHEGKTFHQYDDHWEERPRYLVHTSDIADKVAWLDATRYYRLAFRDIASSTNERTGIFCMLTPSMVCGHTALCERTANARRSKDALLLLGIVDSFCFDWPLRQKSTTHISLFILNGCPVPQFSEDAEVFLIHNALRLSCNHRGYQALWEEQLGKVWREKSEPLTWPVLGDKEDRWSVRAAMDAVVADAYGLEREQYAYLLSTFSHTSYPKAPELCLAAFDELQQIGGQAFCQKHDPYFDIPLYQEIAKPVLPDWGKTRSNTQSPEEQELPTQLSFLDMEKKK